MSSKRPLISRLRTFIFKRVFIPLSTGFYRKVYGMQIGEGTRISRKARLDTTHPGGLKIGKYTAIVAGASVLTHDFVNRTHASVTIGDNCFIGYGAIVLPGITIGDSVIVAGNSVVGRDVPSNCVVMGNPARVVERDIVTGPWGIRLDKGNDSPVEH